MDSRTWNTFQLYQSIDALRQFAKRRIGFDMPLNQAKDIRACLYQAREYYRSASNAEITIKPLLLFYGMTNLAKVVTMLFGGNEKSCLSKLSPKHGIHGIDFGRPIEETSCKIGNGGTFPAFNDIVACNKLFKGENFSAQCVNETSSSLSGSQFRLIDLLGYFSPLEGLHRRTFGSYGRVVPVELWSRSYDRVDLRLYPTHPHFPDSYASDLEPDDQRLNNLRERFSVATVDESPGDKSTLTMDLALLSRLPGRWMRFRIYPENLFTSAEGIILLDDDDSPLVPISPLSASFLTMFILGSVVRYLGTIPILALNLRFV